MFRANIAYGKRTMSRCFSFPSDQSLAGKIPRHGVTVGTTNSGTGTDGGDTGKWRGGIEYGTFSGV